MQSPKDNSVLVKEEAKRLGFDFCGISRAGFLGREEANRLENWLKKGKHGTMAWMENHFDKRLDPTKLVPGSKSVISLMVNYFPKEDLPGRLKISKYAYGEDYHWVIKRTLKSLVKNLQEKIGQFEARVFVDSAPVMERQWAAKAGLGWQGKHTLLINKGAGSFYFLGEIICDVELEADGPTTDHCGNCTRCIDACPTGALDTPYQVDASKCISYLTIELKEHIPQNFKGKMENWVFGCDICQDVCPWNRFKTTHQTPAFEPPTLLVEQSSKDFKEITQEIFPKVFKDSPVKRTKWEGFLRNLRFVD